MRVFSARAHEAIFFRAVRSKCIDRDGKSRYVRCTKTKTQTYR